MPPRRQRIKPEPANVLGDYPTPAESAYTARTVTPRREYEEIDLTSDDDSPAKSFKTQLTEDEGYASRAHQQHRSTSASTSPHRPIPPTFHSPRPPPMATSKPQGLEFVGSKVKLLVDAISDLRRFNLEHVAPLPELVLVGDQSAGKSSLMSALTEVKLPRDQGICTKCPANIKTSSATKWSCKISLHQKYRYVHTGRTINESTVRPSNPYPPWVKQDVPEEKLFMTTDKKDDLEAGIKWAQLALLNHDTDYRLFMPGTGDRARGDYQEERQIAEAKFSPNLIVVEISGPGLPALSFYDLPGVFRSAGKPEDQYLVKVIENLAVEYISRQNALIIWTLAMKTDPSNSETGNIIAKCKALQRTIGVLTNPDHVAVRHVEYEKVLQGYSHIVGHGYFVTKQPGEDSTLDGPDYHAQARKEEETFFDTNSLWREDWFQFRDRCGTTIIQKYLSQELAKRIQAGIPDIEKKIRDRTSKVERDLNACPPPPADDVRIVILRLLAEFSADVKGIMNGDSVDIMTTFQSDWSGLADQFRDLILHIKPGVTVSHASDNISKDTTEHSDDEDDEPQVLYSRKRPAPDGDRQQLPRKNARTESVTPVPQTPRSGRGDYYPHSRSALKQEAASTYGPPIPSPQLLRFKPGDERFVNTPFVKLTGLGKRAYTLDGIRQTIANHTRPGLSSLPNEKTHNELCMLAVDTWETPLEVFGQATFDLVRKQIETILYKRLEKYAQTELFRAAKAELTKFMDEHENEQQKVMQDIFQMERYKIFTVNKAAMNANKQNEYQLLQKARRATRAKAVAQRKMRSDPKKYPLEMDYEERSRILKKKTAEVKDEELSADPFDEELQVAAYVRGYYLTAATRFVDNVCLSINAKLFRGIRESIFMYLENVLDIHSASEGDEICRKLMEEDDMIAGKRRKLQLEKERLIGFSERLAKLVDKINQPDESEIERAPSVERDNFTVSESHRAMEDINEELDSENTIMVDLEN